MSRGSETEEGIDNMFHGVFRGRMKTWKSTKGRVHFCRQLEGNVWREMLHRDGGGGRGHNINSVFFSFLPSR